MSISPSSFNTPGGITLDPFSTTWATLNECGNQMIGNAVSVLSTRPISTQVVRQAAQRIMNKNSVLQASINRTIDENGRRRLSFNKVTSEPDVQSLNLECWNEAWKVEQTKPFNLSKRVWKLRVLKSQTTSNMLTDSDTKITCSAYRTWILGCFHHACFDGIARQSFFMQLLEQIRDIQQNSSSSSNATTVTEELSSESLDADEVDPFPPQISSIMPESFLQKILTPVYQMGDEALFQFGCGITNIFRKVLVPKKNPFPVNIHNNDNESYTNITPIKLDKQTTKSLLALSKMWKCPLNSILTAIAASAAKDVIPGYEGRAMNLYSLQALSSRRFFTIENQQRVSGIKEQMRDHLKHFQNAKNQSPSSVRSDSTVASIQDLNTTIPENNPVDIKKPIKLPKLGNYCVLSGLDISVPADPSSPSQLRTMAEKINKDIHKKVDRDSPTAACADWEVISRFLSAQCEAGRTEKLKGLLNPKPRPSMFLISNTGLFRTNELNKEGIIEENASICNDGTKIISTSVYSPRSHCSIKECSESKSMIELESSFSAVSQHRAGNSLFSHNLTTLHGRLNWSIQSPVGLVDEKTGAIYAKAVMENIHNLLSTAGNNSNTLL